ncbi:MAG TPA: DUF2783 domain-containing protein [Xanthomonadales bacterium]|nr:DUF2783 domain-containing protein [Xanthomonadales bacterium]
MNGVILTPHFEDPDGFYAALIEHHRDLGEADCAALNARLVLILANHIGTAKVLLEALTVARKSLDDGICRTSSTSKDGAIQP